jgi:hypothetical protein
MNNMFRKPLSLFLALGLSMIAGCGGHANPTTVNLDNQDGLYYCPNVPDLGYLVMVFPAGSSPLYGYAYPNAADAAASIKAGLPWEEDSTHTLTLLATLAYTGQTAPHANLLSFTLKTSTDGTDFATALTGTAHFTASGGFVVQAGEAQVVCNLEGQ